MSTTHNIITDIRPVQDEDPKEETKEDAHQADNAKSDSKAVELGSNECSTAISPTYTTDTATTAAISDFSIDNQDQTFRKLSPDTRFTRSPSRSRAGSAPIMSRIDDVKSEASSSSIKKRGKRRSGPLTPEARRKAALMRKIGACEECRRKRVACHTSHLKLSPERLLGEKMSDQPQIIRAKTIPGTVILPSTARPPESGIYRHQTDLGGAGAQFYNTDKNTQELGNLIHETRFSLSRSPRQSIPRHYQNVSVLLIHWEDDDRGVREEVEQLQDVFKRRYQYQVDVAMIPSQRPYQWIIRRVSEFVDDGHESFDTLKIVYYSGQSFLDNNNQVVWFNNYKREATVKWGGIQKILEEAYPDVLILLDCCIGVPDLSSRTNDSTTELIGCSGAGYDNAPPGPFSFTRALTTELSARAIDHNYFTTYELYAGILARMTHNLRQSSMSPGVRPATVPIHVVITQDLKLPRAILLSAAPLKPGAGVIPSASYIPGPAQPIILPSPDRMLIDKKTFGEVEYQRIIPRQGYAEANIKINIQLCEDWRGGNTVDSRQLARWLRMFPLAAQDIQIDLEPRPTKIYVQSGT